MYNKPTRMNTQVKQQQINNNKNETDFIIICFTVCHNLFGL